MTFPEDYDAVALLRDERPEPTIDRALTPPSISQLLEPARSSARPTRQRRTRRLGIAVALAAAAVLGGLQIATSQDSGAPGVRSISVAEAKELAVSALQDVQQLEDYTMVTTWTSTEVGGDERVVSSRTDSTVIDGNRSSRNTQRNDYVDLDVVGAEARTIAGRTYVESNSPRVKQRWMLALKPGGSVGGWFFPPPETTGIVAQLEREGLVTAKREENGTVHVEVKRTAEELADVDGMTTQRSLPDPITSLATGIARMGDEDTIVAARLTISRDGELRSIRVSARYPGVVPDGQGGREVLQDVVNEYRLSPPRGSIVPPDPHDVMVVGDILRTRKGATGVDGPHDTLDTYTTASLRALARKVRTSPRDMTGYQRPPRTDRPARDYTAHFQRVAAKRRALLRELARIDRSPAALAGNSRCTPFWPDSGRAMERDLATGQPDRAGWRCHLETVDAYVSTEPGARGWSFEFIGGGGGGCCFTDKDFARYQ